MQGDFLSLRQVLIWKIRSPGSEYDIDRGIDCRDQYVKTIQNGNFNIGNRLWLQGLMSVIDTGENQYVYRTPEMSADEINDQFDFIILPEANLLSERYQGSMKEYIAAFSRIKIPVYIIACGAEAPSFEALDDLVKNIGDVSSRFIETIYNTGGEFALRGEFTKALFDRLGFSGAVVTGCTSLYQMGRAFHVPGVNQNEDIRPIFNGRISTVQALMKAWPQSEHMDQEAFLHALYMPKGNKLKYKDLLALYRRHGLYATELLRDDRIRLVPDMYNWHTYMAHSNANYSFGTRIHGNIMAIMSGIPATVVAIDSRTREMAEFFNLPYIIHKRGHSYSPEELQACYTEADYSKFNETFSTKYDAFAKFLIDHQIVSHLNEENAYFDSDKEYYEPPMGINRDYYRKAADYMAAHETIFKLGSIALGIKKRLHF